MKHCVPFCVLEIIKIYKTVCHFLCMLFFSFFLITRTHVRRLVKFAEWTLEKVIGISIILKNILIYLPFFVRLFYKTPKHKFSTFIWNNKILDRGSFKAMIIRKMFIYKPAWRSPFMLSPLSSHIYRSSIFYSRHSYVTFFFLDITANGIYIRNDWFFLDYVYTAFCIHF